MWFPPIITHLSSLVFLLSLPSRPHRTWARTWVVREAAMMVVEILLFPHPVSRAMVSAPRSPRTGDCWTRHPCGSTSPQPRLSCRSRWRRRWWRPSRPRSLHRHCHRTGTPSSCSKSCGHGRWLSQRWRTRGSAKEGRPLMRLPWRGCAQSQRSRCAWTGSP